MRYFRLLKTFYKNAILAELEYRANFFVNIVTNLFWLSWSVIGLQVFFNHTDQIGGWTYDEALVVIGVFNVAFGFMEAFLTPNILEIGNQVRLGTLDFVLTKPINSQFMVSMRTMVFWKISDMLLGLGIIAIALLRQHAAVTPAGVFVFGILMLCAAVMLYTVSFLLVTTAFWFVRVDNILEVFNAFIEAGRYPITVYRGAVRVLLTFFVPIAFITTVPASALIDKLDPVYALYSVLFAAGLFLFSAWFWRYALRFYSSASS
jgi:ABC-2 type transport system permease protein